MLTTITHVTAPALLNYHISLTNLILVINSDLKEFNDKYILLSQGHSDQQLRAFITEFTPVYNKIQELTPELSVYRDFVEKDLLPAVKLYIEEQL